MIRNGRRTLAALLALLMVLVLLPTVSAQADGEIEISNYEQLKAFAARVNARETGLNAKLTEDIVCKNSPDDTDYANDWTPIGTYNKPYRGTFDGQGYKIIGLSNADVDYSGLSDHSVYIGLFGRSGGTVENVVLEDCDLSFASDADVYVYMGAVVGRNDGTVKACSVSGKLSAALTISSVTAGIGGVVGYNKNTVKTCTNSGAVSVSGNIPSIYVGGVVGDSGGAEQYCANTGAVSGAGNVMVGGVVGYCNSVKNCFNTGAVSGDDGPTGGIVGFTAYGTVENCLNVGTVTGDFHTGGIIGQNNYGTVKTCLSVGAVSGSGRYIGGVVGMCPNNASVKSYVENCYCLDTSASAAIGDVGTAVVTSVSALTAEQLKSIENCAGFDTVGGWYEGLYYPVQAYYAAAIHLYANSNEDLVIASYLPAFVPTKIANPFTYADHDFTGWNTDPDGDGDPYSEDDAFTLQPGEALTLYARWKISAFTITFLNEDGSELQSGEVLLGKTPAYTGKEPTKPATAQYTYTFAGWKDENGIVYGLTDDLPAVNGDMTYTAIYTSTVNEYTITFVNEDGTELQSGKVAYGETPEYKGETPTKEKTLRFEYMFAGWDPEIVPVTGDATYTAVFTESLLHPIFICGDVDAMDVVVKEGDETLYRYDVTVTDLLDGAVEVNSAQIFLTYDRDKLELKRGEGAVDWTINDADELLSAAWASDSTTTLKNGDVVLTLYFAAKNVAPGETVAIGFAQNDLGLGSALSFVEEGETTEFFAKTQDGSITFAMPDAVTIAGADVLSGDIYAIENGKILYRYDLRMKDLPEAGLWINSAQIFVEFDHAILALARTEGAFDWTVTENGDKLMAVWASDEDVQINEDDVVLTLWFEKIGEAPEDGRVPIVFTTNLLGNTSAVSIAFF
ncbi:MAG: InlB B-repeat-containing protein, partial [Clostridia bacterium]|nr:InlB B-repeat-containing protein [Clostridia bacterium]